MKLMQWAGMTALAGVVLFGLATCGSYSKLVGNDETINSKSGDVRVLEQARYDKIPNLVSIAEASVHFERGTLNDITENRAKVGQLLSMDPAQFAATPELQKQLIEASQKLSTGLKAISVTVEAYPDLKSNQQLSELMAEVSGAENRIAYARGQVQDATREYNTERRQPLGQVVRIFASFPERPYFDSTPGSERPPQVKIDTNAN